MRPSVTPTMNVLIMVLTPSFKSAPMDLYTMAPRNEDFLESVTTPTNMTALADLNVTHPSLPNTVIGCTVSSVMRLLALVIGPAGMELLLNSSVLVDFSTMRKHMLVIGHPMLQAARSTLSVLRILMPMYPLVPLVKDTGPAKEGTLVSSVAQPLLCLTNSLADVSPHLQ